MSEDLGIKVGTPEEIEWTNIKTNQEESIMKNKINIALSEVVLELANKRITEEKQKV